LTTRSPVPPHRSPEGITDEHRFPSRRGDPPTRVEEDPASIIVEAAPAHDYRKGLRRNNLNTMVSDYGGTMQVGNMASRSVQLISAQPLRCIVVRFVSALGAALQVSALVGGVAALAACDEEDEGCYRDKTIDIHDTHSGKTTTYPTVECSGTIVIAGERIDIGKFEGPLLASDLATRRNCGRRWVAMNPSRIPKGVTGGDASGITFSRVCEVKDPPRHQPAPSPKPPYIPPGPPSPVPTVPTSGAATGDWHGVPDADSAEWAIQWEEDVLFQQEDDGRWIPVILVAE
jgi:hypothetical protein